MNSLQRIKASMRGDPVDHTPVSPIVSHYAAVQARQPMTKVAFDPELMANVLLNSLEKHGFDSIRPIGDAGLGTESMGSRALIRDWEQTSVVEFAVKSRHDAAKLRVPDPFKDGRMPVFLDCQRILARTVGGEVEVGGGITGPLSFAACLRGTQELLRDLKRDPDLVHELVQISLEAGKAFGEAQIAYSGVKSINVYEACATLISNPMAEEFSFPYLEQLMTHLKNLGATVLLHICQDSTRFLNRMVEIGADIVSVDVEVDLAKAKEIVGGRATILGNVGSLTLALKGPKEVYEESCQCIAKAGAGGRFILSSACEVPVDTPAANIDAMVRAAREFSVASVSRDATDPSDDDIRG